MATEIIYHADGTTETVEHPDDPPNRGAARASFLVIRKRRAEKLLKKGDVAGAQLILLKTGA